MNAPPMSRTHVLRGRPSMRSRSRGFTLVETIVAIVIISAASASILGVLSATAARSAEAGVRTQAVSIANAYLEEILSKAWIDPGGGPELGRADFDNVGDYNSNAFFPVADQFGNAVPGLGGYTVRVRVFNNAAIGGSPNAVPDARRIEVTVRTPTGSTVVMNGYRTRYASRLAYDSFDP